MLKPVSGCGWTQHSAARFGFAFPTGGRAALWLRQPSEAAKLSHVPRQKQLNVKHVFYRLIPASIWLPYLPLESQ